MTANYGILQFKPLKSFSCFKGWAGVLLYLLVTGLNPAQAAVNSFELAEKATENQIKNIIEPLLDKYCHDECKLLSVQVTVDEASSEESSPGFHDIQARSDKELEPTSAKLKILIDDKVGPISRKKLIELLQQYLDTLPYPTKIDEQITHFPQPVGSELKVSELRERISKQFQNTVLGLIQQFCPEQCLFADFNLKTDAINAEESQYVPPGEFIQESGVALRIREISGTLLFDETLSSEEKANILEVIKLKTNSFNNVTLATKSMKFPKPAHLTQSQREPASDKTTESKSTSENTKQERFERIEKIERVENGDAIQTELQKFKFYGMIFGCSILSLLIFIVIASFRPLKSENPTSSIHRVIQQIERMGDDPSPSSNHSSGLAPEPGPPGGSLHSTIRNRYENERLSSELNTIYAENPKVAKYVFTRILTEEGLEVASKYLHIFGEGIVIDMLYDPSLQSDLSGLMEYYAKNPIHLKDDEKLDLLQRLHNRTIAGKMAVLGNRSSHLFDFLTEMDSTQILELIRTESLTVKAIVLTQCDIQKRSSVYAHLDENIRMNLLTELSRIDYLPRDYVFNVANALKRKRKENPKLNTEALPGSEVLVTLLERTGMEMQRDVIKNLENSSPDSARTVKSKLVSTDTLRFLRDSQLLEVILSLRHDELLQFLKGAPEDIRKVIFAKSPKELVNELEEELANHPPVSRENYYTLERKVLNRMKIMANEGLLNLIETNERMFADGGSDAPREGGAPPIKKVSGW